mmetsp:Transcript_1618/g.3353  ORF Transcript_1618/g.3353 Transcript_1618/m.3353 type:complete len:152 (+) Transcript_1618:107-562(+)
MCTRKAIPRRVTFETPSKSVAGMQEQQQFQQQQTFPFKLYNMLEYACDSEFGSCISWTADGSAFIIHDKDVMMDNIAPMFFNQTKFRSFVSILILTAVAVEVTQCLLLLSISTLLDLAALFHHYVSLSSHNLPLPLEFAHTNLTYTSRLDS